MRHDYATRRLGATAALLAALHLACLGDARSAEVWIEPLRTAEAVNERWSSGTVEYGREGGFRWVRCTTYGQARPALLANVEPYDPPLDLRGRFLKVWIRVDDPSQVSTLELRVSSDNFASNHFAFPVPLFADPEFGLLQAGRWIPLTFSFGAARTHGAPDRSRINAVGWYIEDAGKAPLEIAWGGLAALDIRFDGVVSFTFDDGYDEHARVAAPILAKASMRATAYVMPDQIGKKGYMTLVELEHLRDQYGWDVAAHHAIPFTDFSSEKLESTILGIRRFLTVHGFDRGADHLALPLGKHDPDHVLPLVRKYFRTTRIAGAGPETLPPADPHRLRVLNVLASTPPETVAAWVQRARANGEWGILMFHYLVDEARKDTDYSIARFREVVQRVSDVGIPVRTVNEVWNDLEQRRPRAARGTRPAPASPAPLR